jgi:subtilisin
MGASLPEWTAPFVADPLEPVRALPLPGAARDWAIGGATGAGVRVAVVDSGVEAAHPWVGGLVQSVAVEADDAAPSGYRVVEQVPGDLVGHGTACAGIIRSIAPDVELSSVRVLGSDLRGRGEALRMGVSWAVAAGMDVVNLSLSSKSEAMFGPLHEVADAAYFRSALLVCAANNLPGPTYPSQFATVISVAARPGTDPLSIAYNPRPPVEFGARGIDVEVAWGTAGSIVASGNSFAAPHVSGLVALIRSKHPHLNAFQVKSVLQALCDNAVGDPDPSAS